MLKKWLHEPLLHFLLIGALLFVVYGFQNNGISDQNKRIIFTKADISRLSLMWQKQRQRPPTQTELQGLIEQQIREQVLYREALAMGLDKNDSIVRRRLAQKVEFISADLAALVEPNDTELTDYLAANPDRFFIPGRIDFVQIYFNSDKRGTKTKSDAAHILSKLNQPKSSVDVMTAGDNFMMGQYHKSITDFEISRLFGNTFTKQLSALAVGRWHGPIDSGYGYHLVRIDNKIAKRQPELDAVRDNVRNEWMNQQRRSMDKAFYQSLRQRYDVVIEDEDIKDLTMSEK